MTTWDSSRVLQLNSKKTQQAHFHLRERNHDLQRVPCDGEIFDYKHLKIFRVNTGLYLQMDCLMT